MLAGFMLMGIGLLLLINGARLHDRWRDHLDRNARKRLRHSHLTDRTTPPAPLEGRMPIADLMAWHVVNRQRRDQDRRHPHR
ncbi:hypothetical protein PX699_00060 [Sphingobium sp. H39-3-25]|uniref:hypothetical protein n=1 Tax=Sphingobium arseniciresistens TaxID=3030834 RepID=UPI0023B93629|nr:hypothetical protein [Sphingobium arseniciresistens]